MVIGWIYTYMIEVEGLDEVRHVFAAPVVHLVCFNVVAKGTEPFLYVLLVRCTLL